MAFKVTLEFIWFAAGWKEIYYWSGSGSIDQALLAAAQMAVARNILLIQTAGLYLYELRVVNLDTPAQKRRLRLGTVGAYTTGKPFHTGPWDAADIEFTAANGAKKEMQMRGIPDSINDEWGPGSPPGVSNAWIASLFKPADANGPASGFAVYLGSHNFSVQSSKNTQATLPVTAVTPNVTAPLVANVPQGALIIAAAGHGIGVGQASPVIFKNLRCTPKVSSRHVGVGIDAGTFWLKNTDVGQIVYNGGALVGKAVPTYNQIIDAEFIRSGPRKPGRPPGMIVGRRLKKI